MVGDPKWALHPVEVIGTLIVYLRKIAEKLSTNNRNFLRLGGVLITFIVIFLSGLCGWGIERLTISKYFIPNSIGLIILIFSLSSALASRSLEQSIRAVIDNLKAEDSDKLKNAKNSLKGIVSREVNNMEEGDILRAAAETASENAVDGVFAPLFWMIIGSLFWEISTQLPGPLCLVWIYKASSTLDSMIGYKYGNLRWLGTASARLEDFLTWIPCRLVVISLPLVSKPLKEVPGIIRKTLIEGAQYESPNAGYSQAIYANCLGISMGGFNQYKGKKVFQPLIGNLEKDPIKESIYEILNLTIRLEFYWIIYISGIKLIYQIIIN